MRARWLIPGILIGLTVTLNVSLVRYSTIMRRVQEPGPGLMPESEPAITYARILDGTHCAFAGLSGIAVAANPALSERGGAPRGYAGPSSIGR